MSSPRFFDRRARPAQNLVHREVVDLRQLSERETKLVEQARSLALDIEQKSKSSLVHYYDLGKIVGEINLSHRQLADRIGLRGFGHATLSDAVVFHNYVQKTHRGNLENFILAFENDPNYSELSVSWHNVRDYIRRSREPASQSELEADEQFDRKEAIEPWRKFAE